MNIFFVNRHTRVDEELGRHEMLASLPVGRLSGSLATIKMAFLLNATVSVLSALAIIAINIEGTTASGAFAYTLSIGAQGMVFASVTLLAAQLFGTARGSMGVSFAALGLAYIMRASGDMADNALSYISPMGLGLKVEAFYTDDFAPVAILFAEAVVIAAIALFVNTKRDVGAGVFAARKSKAHASRFLLSPFGFAWRLSKNNFIAWAVAFFVLGAMYGTVIGELDKFVEGNDMIKQMLEAQGGSGSLAESFLPMLCGIMAWIAAIPAIGAMNRMRVEEKRGRMEQIYARAVSRASIFGSFTIIAIFESLILMFLSGIGLYATSQGTGILPLETILGASFVYVPAILVFAGLSALLVGLLPKLTSIVWALFGYSFLMLYFGRLFDVPEWATRISPFGNTPGIPVQEFNAIPLVLLLIIAAALTAAGYFAGYKRRDVMA
jgi:ABC-2 type transport system permease protein